MGFFSKPEIKIKKIEGDIDLPVIHIIHGIHSGGDSTGVIAPYYTALGFRVWIWDYGDILLTNARLFKNPYVVERLKKEVEEGDIGIGHSNGCAILAKASDEGVKFSGLVFINPALNKNRRINENVEWVRIYYNEGDNAVLAGKFFRWLDPVSWFKQHPYGEMGRKGISYSDYRVQNINCTLPPNKILPKLDGHSAFFEKGNLEPWSKFDAANVKFLSLKRYY